MIGISIGVDVCSGRSGDRQRYLDSIHKNFNLKNNNNNNIKGYPLLETQKYQLYNGLVKDIFKDFILFQQSNNPIMSFFPRFDVIRQDLFQLFSDIERDLGLDPFPSTDFGRRRIMEDQQQQPQQLTSGQGQGQISKDTSTPMTTTGTSTGTAVSTQGANIDFSKPLAANFKIQNEPDKFVASGEFPGVRPEDLHISVKNGMLTLDARRGVAKERREKSPDNTMRSYSYSSSSERVARSIPLPPGVDESRVDTTFNNGKLMLTLGKTQQAIQAGQQEQAANKQTHQTMSGQKTGTAQKV